MKLPKITLDNVLGEGGLEQLFQKGIIEIVENIKDVNTEAKKSRELIIKFKFTPDKDRNQIYTQAKIGTKLVGVETETKVNYLSTNQHGEAELGTVDPLNIPLFQEVK